MRSTRAKWQNASCLLLISLHPLLPNYVGKLGYDIIISDKIMGEKSMSVIIITNGKNNDKELQVKWAIKSRSNVETLIIHLSFINPLSLYSCQNKSGEYGDSCSLGYAVNLILNIDLPTFTSISADIDGSQKNSLRAELFMQSILQGTKNLSAQQWKNIDVETAVSMLTVGPGVSGSKIIDKPNKFGLRVLGVENNHNSIIRPLYADIFYDGATPVSSEFVIACPEAKASMDESEGVRSYTPQCEQYIQLDDLSAVLKIRYDRQYLKDWHEIGVGARAMMNKFLQGEH